jgi:hypothetical protein
MNTIDLNDPNWRPYSPDTTKALHIFPNQLWHNSVGNLGALVIFKPQAHEEFPVNQAGTGKADRGLCRVRSPPELGASGRRDEGCGRSGRDIKGRTTEDGWAVGPVLVDANRLHAGQ